MEVMDTSDSLKTADEWELSKENVQPLKHGRKFANLSAALQPLPLDQAKFKEQKESFESELRTYSGEDPFDVWDRYIKWTEQNYPKGGKDSNLTTLLERCVGLFKDHSKYKNDPRYIEAWIKFANFCNGKLEIYNYLFNQGIGSETAAFYVAWAGEYEEMGNNKKADAIYKQGIEVAAFPLEKLHKMHSEFQTRVARKLASGESEETQDSPSGGAEPQRQALNALKQRGKKGTVGTTRVGTAVQSRQQGGLKLGSGPSKPNAGSGFQVFCDENADAPVLPPQTAEWSTLPKQSEINRENTQKAGVWTKAKLPQRSTSVVPIDAVSSYKQPGFVVHEDSEQPLATPRKSVSDFNPALSARKEKDNNPFLRVTSTAQNEGNTRPMYCKDKVYAGTGEFQLEEVRAARWRAKQKQKEEIQRLVEAEKRAWQVEFERQQEALRHQQEALSQQRQEMQRQHEELIRQQMEQLSVMQQAKAQQQQQQDRSPVAMQEAQHSQQVERQRQQELQRQMEQEKQHQMEQERQRQMEQERQRQMEQERQRQMEQERQHHMEQERQHQMEQERQRQMEQERQHQMEQERQRQMEQERQQQLQNRSKNMSYKFPENSFNVSMSQGGSDNLPPLDLPRPTPTSSFINNSINNSQRTPNLSSLNNTSSSANKTRSNGPTPDSNGMNSFRGSFKYNKGSLTAPSPTVNTKLAYQVVYGMFNNTLNVSRDLSWHGDPTPEDRDFDAEFADTKADGLLSVAQPSSSAFTPVPATSMPFTVYEDTAEKETVAPPALDKENQENCPPGGYKNPPKRKSTAGILVLSNDVPFVPLEEQEKEEEEEIEGGFLEKDMEGIECMPECGDMTFAPFSSSTKNFSEAARLASTPFGDHAPLGALPLSNIKLKNVIGSNDLENKTVMTEYSAQRDEEKSMETDSKLGGASRIIASHEEQTFETTMLPPKSYKLSPIMETSDEDNKSVQSLQGISLGASHGHTLVDPHQHPSTIIEEDDDENLLMKSVHVIDTTNYFPEEEEEAEAAHADLLSMSIAIDPHDPFDEELVKRFLARLPQPITTYPQYHDSENLLPSIQPNMAVNLGDDLYNVERRLGEGAYAEVYQVSKMNAIDMSDLDSTEEMVIKVQKPACPWEFYITTELHKRIMYLGSPIDVSPSLMSVHNAYFYPNGSCLVTELHKNGTLLDLANILKMNKSSGWETLHTYVTIELLAIAEQLQKSHIIHGDVKPDNYLIANLDNLPVTKNVDELIQKTGMLKLIDFGRSIDMKMFPANTTFTAKVTTSGFQCIEMLTNRPWTYQTDLFGIAGSIHVLMFGEYMKVTQVGGQWKINRKLPRFVKKADLWKKFYDTLLNIPSCDELPDIGALRREFTQYLIDLGIDQFNSMTERLGVLLFDHRNKRK